VTDQGRRLANAGVAVLYVLTLGTALLAAESYAARGTAPGAGSDPAHVLLGAAGGGAAALFFLRDGRDERWLLRAALLALMATAVYDLLGAVGLPSAAALGGAAAAFLGAWLYPEWYVVDAVAVAVGAGVSAQVGVALAPRAVLVVLAAATAYDLYAVYSSDRMAGIAGGAFDLRLPVIYVVPRRAGFSMRDREGSPADPGPGPGRAGAALLGLGDAFVPGVLVVAAATRVGPVPAATALAGAALALVALQTYSARAGGLQAGLPFLVPGAVAGYLLGVVAAGVPLAVAVGG